MAGGKDIVFDRMTGAIENANVLERLTIALLKLGAWLTRPARFVGFSYGARVLRAIAGGPSMVLKIDRDVAFRFPFADGYWSTMVLKDEPYEVELEAFFRAIRDVDFVLLDCGANFGYWSVFVSGKALGAKTSVAVEAASVNFDKLAANAALNGGRFKPLHRALGEQSGEIVEIRGYKHEAFSAAGPANAPVIDRVETLSLDGMLAIPEVAAARRLVVKLDVEGVEKEAVRGGRTLLAGDSILVAEDHGADKTHDISHFLKDQEGYRLFIAEGGRYREVTDIDATLGPYKKNTHVGYNVFATKSPFWIERLGAIRSVQLN